MAQPPRQAVLVSQAATPTLWDHVYNLERLIVKQKCISVSGTIVDATNGQRSDGVRKEADWATTRVWLKSRAPPPGVAANSNS
jgi:hypothetical protein